MSYRQRLVAAYMDGFRRSDHEQILACLTDDVIWDLPGFRHLAGKEAFDGEIENEAFAGRPVLTEDKILKDGDVVVVTGTGEGRFRTGAIHRFAFCDLFTFRDDLLCRVESYVVPLPAA